MCTDDCVLRLVLLALQVLSLDGPWGMLRMLYPWSLWVASVMLGSVVAFAWKRRPVVIKSSLGDVRLCISIHLEARISVFIPGP